MVACHCDAEYSLSELEALSTKMQYQLPAKFINVRWRRKCYVGEGMSLDHFIAVDKCTKCEALRIKLAAGHTLNAGGHPPYIPNGKYG